jgi:hypothetical protein
MRFGATVAAVLASLAIASGPATAAYAAYAVFAVFAGSPASLPTGNDVSYPQCSGTLPVNQAFGIVAVNEGLANTTNPCLAMEISWAQTSTGAAGQPRIALYVNTANPGPKVADWPANNDDPVTGNRVADPYGTCVGADSTACAWQYGWDLADLDAQTRGVQSPGSYRWWLDLETANSWERSAQNNRADLEGMATYFHHIGGTVGIYSTPKQWDPIVGAVRPASPLYRLPDWIPGAKTLAQAKKNCRLTPLTAGGTVSVAQWATPPTNTDLSCSSLPRPARK